MATKKVTKKKTVKAPAEEAKPVKIKKVYDPERHRELTS